MGGARKQIRAGLATAQSGQYHTNAELKGVARPNSIYINYHCTTKFSTMNMTLRVSVFVLYVYTNNKVQDGLLGQHKKKCRMGFWDNIKNMANHCFNAIKIVANAGVSKIKSLANDYGSKTEGLAKACFNKISNAFGIEPDGVFESLTGQRVSVALDILLICFRLKSWLEMGWYLLFWLLSCF